jgi:hypothetical protein
MIIIPGPIRTNFWLASALESAHKGAPKHAARASAAGGTFWGTFVGGSYGGSLPKKSPNPARKNNQQRIIEQRGVLPIIWEWCIDPEL